MSKLCVCILIQRIADLLPTSLVYLMIEILARGDVYEFQGGGRSSVLRKRFEFKIGVGGV